MPSAAFPVLQLIIAALMWSVIGVFVKGLPLHPLGIAGIASMIAVVVQALYLRIFARRKLSFNWSKAQIFGAVAYALNISCFITANYMTTTANAVLLQCTAPVFLALFGGRYLGEYLKLRDYLLGAIVLFGTSLFFMDRLDGGRLIGNICGIICGFALAWYTICLRLQKNESPHETVLLGNILIAIVGAFFIDNSVSDLHVGARLLLLGSFGLSIPFILYCEAIKQVRAIDAVLITTLEPILSPVWVFLVHKEVPSVLAITGGMIVLGSVTVWGYLIARNN
ncbi:DMT family transporter [bacterium]|nr:DMT family transporter [bacterium]